MTWTLTSVHQHRLFPAAVFPVVCFSSSGCPQTDTALVYNIHSDSCTHMDRTGLEFHFVFAKTRAVHTVSLATYMIGVSAHGFFDGFCLPSLDNRMDLLKCPTRADDFFFVMGQAVTRSAGIGPFSTRLAVQTEIALTPAIRVLPTAWLLPVPAAPAGEWADFPYPTRTATTLAHYHLEIAPLMVERQRHARQLAFFFFPNCINERTAATSSTASFLRDPTTPRLEL